MLAGSEKLDREIKIKMATKSWVKKIPTTSLPYKLCKSFFSPKSLTTIIVEEKVKAGAIYQRNYELKPKTRKIKNPMRSKNYLAKPDQPKAVRPILFSWPMSSWRPTINKSRVMPICPNALNTSPCLNLIIAKRTNNQVRLKCKR